MSHSYPPFSRAKSSALPLAFAGGAFALAAYLVIDRVDLFALTDATDKTLAIADSAAALVEQGDARVR